MAGEGASWQGTPGPHHPAPSGTGCSCLHGTFQRAGRGLQTGQVRWQAPGLAARPPGEKAQARLTNGSLPGERTGTFHPPAGCEPTRTGG